MISVGIDVSKGKSTVCILKPGGEVIKPPFEMDHTVENLDSLVSLIKSFDEETRVVLEDTGHYHLPVASYLSSHGIFVCCVNALRMKKYCSQSIRRAKTDKIDAVRISSLSLLSERALFLFRSVLHDLVKETIQIGVNFVP